MPDDDTEKQEVVTASFTYTQTSDMTVRFELEGADGIESFEALYEEGKLIDPSNYTITRNSDGSFTITFRADFLKTLATGDHIFTLVWSGGSLDIKVTIS